MKVGIILGEGSVLPSYAHKGDAGMDITAIGKSIEGDVITYTTGIKFDLPEGHVGLIYPRSSIYKKDLTLCNSVGVIDSSYEGEVSFKFRLTKDKMFANIYDIGDRIGQVIIVSYPQVEFEELKDFTTSSERGSDGFGSTDELPLEEDVTEAEKPQEEA